MANQVAGLFAVCSVLCALCISVSAQQTQGIMYASPDPTWRYNLPMNGPKKFWGMFQLSGQNIFFVDHVSGTNKVVWYIAKYDPLKPTDLKAGNKIWTFTQTTGPISANGKQIWSAAPGSATEAKYVNLNSAVPAAQLDSKGFGRFQIVAQLMKDNTVLVKSQGIFTLGETCWEIVAAAPNADQRQDVKGAHQMNKFVVVGGKGRGDVYRKKTMIFNPTATPKFSYGPDVPAELGASSGNLGNQMENKACCFFEYTSKTSGQKKSKTYCFGGGRTWDTNPTRDGLVMYQGSTGSWVLSKLSDTSAGQQRLRTARGAPGCTYLTNLNRMVITGGFNKDQLPEKSIEMFQPCDNDASDATLRCPDQRIPQHGAFKSFKQTSGFTVPAYWPATGTGGSQFSGKDDSGFSRVTYSSMCVFGGSERTTTGTGPTSFNKDVFCWDATTQRQWSKMSVGMKYGRRAGEAAERHNIIYVTGGLNFNTAKTINVNGVDYADYGERRVEVFNYRASGASTDGNKRWSRNKGDFYMWAPHSHIMTTIIDGPGRETVYGMFGGFTKDSSFPSSVVFKLLDKNVDGKACYRKPESWVSGYNGLV